ncbi:MULTISPECIES: hypothetical protein [Microbacterium]|uniref:Uncharacterized protein n=1 Tax=Microbacterium saccharophilum TaxID=1213358 RepID=A0A7Z7CYA0_9MICO|nr:MULTISPECIES: hypothetical protein [Microbacterium]SFI16735.1 hypothetical protein SAMN04487751_0036 [Microbacterium saccharophilum]
MSGTANEFDEPGGNYPDAGGPDAKAQASDAGVGGAIADEHDDRDDAASTPAGTPDASAAGTQDAPAMDTHTASGDDKLDGLLAQVRSDGQGQDAAMVEKLLRSRLPDTGLQLDEGRIAALVREISG